MLNVVGVAPLVGAWIEIRVSGAAAVMEWVAPLVGAWIEMRNGLKDRSAMKVAPLVGAWIEITYVFVDT